MKTYRCDLIVTLKLDSDFTFSTHPEELMVVFLNTSMFFSGAQNGILYHRDEKTRWNLFTKKHSGRAQDLPSWQPIHKCGNEFKNYNLYRTIYGPNIYTQRECTGESSTPQMCENLSLCLMQTHVLILYAVNISISFTCQNHPWTENNPEVTRSGYFFCSS